MSDKYIPVVVVAVVYIALLLQELLSRIVRRYEERALERQRQRRARGEFLPKPAPPPPPGYEERP
jgi:hypothetical protein